MAQDFGDVPPPPYSETDIYSNNGGARSRSATGGAATEGATAAQSDNNSQRAADELSVATSSSEVIYTPSMSPQVSNHSRTPIQQLHQTAASPASSQDPWDPAVNPHPWSPHSSNHSGTPSLRPYDAFFASRPVPAHFTPYTTPEEVYHLELKEDSVPDDWPYPGGKWATDYDVSEDDWKTFLNFLFPNYSAQRTEAVIDRKIRDEEEATGGSQHSSRDESVAQLEGARPDREAAAAASTETSGEFYFRVYQVTHDWNNKFFNPRHVNVAVEFVDPDNNPYQYNMGTHQTRQEAQARGDQPEFAAGDSSGPAGPAGYSANADTIILRHTMHNLSLLGGIPHGNLRGRFAHHFGHHDGPMQRSPPHRRRSHSADSSSSSSSSSSSDSDASVGSLPDYDDLREDQLRVAKHAIQTQLDRPEALMTRDSVRQTALQIKAGKKNKNGHENVLDKAELAAARKEVKALLQQWKALKKSQKQAARKLKRDKKKQRRAEKRERRGVKREMRKARKEGRREARKEGKRGRRARHGGGEEGLAQQQQQQQPGAPSGSVPHGVVPGVPRAPVVQPDGPSPMCGPRGGFGGGWFRGGEGGRGRGWGGGPFGGRGGGPFGRGGGPFGAGRGFGGPGNVFGGGRGFSTFWSGAPGTTAPAGTTHLPSPPHDPRGPSGAPGAWPEDEKTPTKAPTVKLTMTAREIPSNPAAAAPQQRNNLRELHERESRERRQRADEEYARLLADEEYAQVLARDGEDCAKA